MTMETKLREKQANDALRELDDMHRTYRIERDEYRWRRRQLLESFSDAGASTVRRLLSVNKGTPVRQDGADRSAMSGTAGRRHNARWTTACIALIGLIGGAVVVCWWRTIG